MKTDKFGRAYKNVACKDRKGRGFPSGIFSVGNRMFKIEPGPSNVEGVDAWVRITELPPRGASRGFGGGDSYGQRGGMGGGMRQGRGF